MTDPFDDFEKIFHPRSMAFVGASGGFENAGTRLLLAHRECGFPGPLYAVNPKGNPVEGFPTYKSLLDIPGPVDHAYMAAPAQAMPQVIRECVEKGLHSVTVFTAGFRETGTPEGVALEEEIVAIAKEGGVRLIGPNCMGIYCPESGMSYRFDFPMRRGPLSLISQSGGVAISSIVTAEERGFGFEKVVSFGNECDITSAELLAHFGNDPRTEVIMAYIEGSRNPGELISAISDTGRVKPVIVLKGGTSEDGSRAAASHTGAMSGANITWEGAFKQANAIHVPTFEDFLDAALTFQRVKRPAGRRMSIISVSGGFCVMLTDMAVERGFEVPTISEKTIEDLKESFDFTGTSIKNPMDLARGFINYMEFEKLFSCLDEDECTDALLFLVSMEYITALDDRMPGFLDNMARALAEACSNINKTVMVAALYTNRDEDRQRFTKPLVEAGLAVYPTAERALDALNCMMNYYEVRERREGNS